MPPPPSLSLSLPLLSSLTLSPILNLLPFSACRSFAIYAQENEKGAKFLGSCSRTKKEGEEKREGREREGGIEREIRPVDSLFVFQQTAKIF